MALIKCPSCNKPLSDKAVNCPHCGFDMNQKNQSVDVGNGNLQNNDAQKTKAEINQENNSNLKKATVTFVVLVLVLIGGFMFYQTKQKKKNEAEQAELYRKQSDSIYANLNTADLAMFNLKGCVKHLTIYGQNDFVYNIDFSKLGDITDWNIKKGEQLLPVNFKRYSDGKIESLLIKNSGAWEGIGTDSYEFQEDYMFSYDENGRMTKLIYQNDEEYQTKYKETFSEFDTNGFPLISNMEGSNILYKFYTESRFDYEEIDDFGNWLNVNVGVTGRNVVQYDDSCSYPYEDNYNLKREITYYSKNELDFNMLLKKK